MNTVALLTQVAEGAQFEFADVLAVIAGEYDFTPTAFNNGELQNELGQNEGSAKVFAFAKLHNLSEQDTLALFAEHYQNVLQTPEGDNHGNIRNFMVHGWAGVQFEQFPLTAK